MCCFHSFSRTHTNAAGAYLKLLMVRYHPLHYRDDAGFQFCSRSIRVTPLNPSFPPMASRWRNIKVRRRKAERKRMFILSPRGKTESDSLFMTVEEIISHMSHFLWQKKSITVYSWCAISLLIQREESVCTSKLQNVTAETHWRNNLWYFHKNKCVMLLCIID